MSEALGVATKLDAIGEGRRCGRRPVTPPPDAGGRVIAAKGARRLRLLSHTANDRVRPCVARDEDHVDTMEKGDMPLKGEYEPNPSGYERRNGVRGGPALSRSVRIAAGQRGFGCRPVRRRAGPSVMVPLTDV